MPLFHTRKTLFVQDVAKDRFFEAQLMLLTFATGVQDATTFSTYRVFTAKQTGNTIFLALYAYDRSILGPRAEQNVVISLIAFVLGGVLFARLARRSRPLCRGWLLATSLIQTLLVFAATALQYWGHEVKVGGLAIATISLLSFANSGQVAMAVGVGLAEINATMITGSLMQLCSDPRLFHLHNPARTRRLMFVLSLMIGCFAGAAACRPDASLGLLVTATVKAAVTVSLLFNRGVVSLPPTEIEKAENGFRPGAATAASKLFWGD